jgi:DNA-binding NtrC family response regulator
VTDQAAANTPSQTQSPSWAILLVDDEDVFARAVATCLVRAGNTCVVATSLAMAREHIKDPPDLVILDMRLPDGDGLDLLPDITGAGDAAPPVIVVTAYGDIGQAVDAMKLGAADYLRKPLDLDELLVTVDKVMESQKLRSRLNFSKARENRSAAPETLLGDSPAITSVRSQIETIAGVGGAAPPTVLIQGETGTGKDVAARMLHRLGPRPDRPFVQVDCASLPKDMIEAELFGHVRGAFTSAHASRAGLIEAAEDGTLFLDEIGELPLALQAKLLNVLERRQVRRVGSTRESPVQARFIAATNRDLKAMVARDEFRDDLYFRLNVLSISMPSLRECRGDLALLAEHFLAITARSYGRDPPTLGADALDAIEHYDWPGNVRELRNVIERAVLLTPGAVVAAESMALSQSVAVPQNNSSSPIGDPGNSTESASTLDDAERQLIAQALRQAKGNASEAARALGVTRMALRYRIEKHGLRSADFR